MLLKADHFFALRSIAAITALQRGSHKKRGSLQIISDSER